MSPTLYHFSEQPDINRFEPRPAPNSTPLQTGVMVWAIEAALQQNYLLPRDCPRVCFSTLPTSTPADVERLIGATAARAVIAIEARWLPLVQQAQLYRYELPAETFALVDESAAYYISHETVLPRAVARIDDLLMALLACDVELRVTPSLWPLCDAVVGSSLRFSCIRMRNAGPRPEMVA